MSKKKGRSAIPKCFACGIQLRYVAPLCVKCINQACEFSGLMWNLDLYNKIVDIMSRDKPVTERNPQEFPVEKYAESVFYTGSVRLVCPFCGGAVEEDDDNRPSTHIGKVTADVDLKCKSCGARWTERFKIASVIYKGDVYKLKKNRSKYG